MAFVRPGVANREFGVSSGVSWVWNLVLFRAVPCLPQSLKPHKQALLQFRAIPCKVFEGIKRALLCQLSYAPTFFQFNIGEGFVGHCLPSTSHHVGTAALTVTNFKSICVTKLDIPESR
jgi:hypothetical protein